MQQTTKLIGIKNLYIRNTLKPFVKYIQGNGTQVQDLVIDGDWFDLWAYPPQTPDLPCGPPASVKDIFEQNQEIFSQVDDEGDFVSCLDSIQGTFYYVGGNHDMEASAEQINAHFRTLSKKGREIKCLNYQGIGYYESEDIHAEHGHRVSLCNRPDNNCCNKYPPLPVSDILLRDLQPQIAVRP